jgi:hypothetical protein
MSANFYRLRPDSLPTSRRGTHQCRPSGTIPEYGLIAALIAAVCVGAVTTLGTDLSNSFICVASSI